jgi:PAS domain S-box-containing protein
MIAGTYNVGLVVLSILIAMVASYAAFNLGERVSASAGQRRWIWLTSGAIAMGFAIWSMHYVGMLAFVLPVPVLYHVPTVIMSLIAAVPGTAVALYIVSKKAMRGVDTAIGGICLGGAVVAMHYTGMAAMRSAAMHHYRLNLVILSVVVAVTFSSVAAWLAFRFRRFHEGFTWTRFGGASLMGLGIASMHYTAMAAAYFMPGSTPPLRHTVQVSTLGAFGIGTTTLLLLGTSLATAWFDRRLQNERLLQRLYRELRDVINTVPAHAWSALPDGNVDFVNERWQQFTGLPPEDALGWNWEAVLHPDDKAKFIGDLRAALSSGHPLETEVRTRRADGEYRCLLIRNVPLRDELGNVIKWYGTGFDIEDRKQAEALLAGEKRILEMVAKGSSLAEILDRLCLLVEELASGVLASILLLDGNRLRHGGAPSLPKAYTDAIDGDVIGPSVRSCGTAAYRGAQVIVEDIATDPLWADYREVALRHSLRACWSTPVFSSQGKVIATFAMYYREPRSISMRDREIIEQITHLAGVAIERKLTQESLRRSETYLAEAQRLTHTGSWAFIPFTAQTIYWSEEMFRIFALDPQQGPPTSEALRQRVHPEDRDSVYELMRKAALEKTEYDHHHRIVLPDGTVKHIHAIGHPVFNHAGEVVEFVGTAIDVTERKRAEQERERLRQLEADLTQINRVSTMGELAASIAHEVNQPLSGIVSNASASLRFLAGDPPNLEEVRGAVRDIVRDGKRAGEIIARVRALTRRSVGPREKLDLNETIQEVLTLVADEAKRKKVIVRTQFADDLSRVAGDRVQLQQVVLNLVMNAIEAMSNMRGRERELVITTRNNDADHVQATVEDSGIGLDPNRIDKIFDSFYTTKPAGMGMGLSISRSILQAHGGRLWVESKDRPGTRFQFTIPKYHEEGAHAGATRA